MIEAKPIPQPKGIGAIITDERGSVVAHAFDFDRSGYGGFQLWEAQKMRARDAVIRDYIASFTYGPIASVISAYQAQEIVLGLQRKGTIKLTYIGIGHDDVKDEINR